MLPAGAGSTIEGMQLDGAGGASDIGPRIYADSVVLRDNEITNEHTSICVSVTAYYSDPPPQGVVIERNRIHDCGALPSTNKDHGIYVTNASRHRDPRQLDLRQRRPRHPAVSRRPAHQGHRQRDRLATARESCSAATGSLTSNHNLVEGNVIADSNLGWNVYSGQTGPVATGNLLRDNCVWAGESSPGYDSNGGVETPSRNFTANANVVADPHYSDPAAGDYTLSPESRCPLAKHCIARRSPARAKSSAAMRSASSSTDICAQVALAVRADRDHAGLLLPIADHQHVGELGDLRVVHLLADRLGAVVDTHPDARLDAAAPPPLARSPGDGRQPAGSRPASEPARPGSGPRGARSGCRRSAPSSPAAPGGSSPAGARRCRPPGR